jgi:hypothetical protein
MDTRTVLIAAKNLLLGANLKSLGLLTRPKEAVHYATECLFIDRTMHSSDDLPQRHPWLVFDVSSNIPIVLVPDAAGEWFKPMPSFGVDLVGLCSIVQIVKPRTIFEVGTYHGSGAIHLSANAPQAEVYTLDLAPSDRTSLEITSVDVHHIDGRRYDDLGARIHRLFGDSATFDFSPFHNQVDLFFIDGAHSYAYVRSDTEKALQCVKKGGVIAWHDYGRCGVNGVSRWLHELRNDGRTIYRVPGSSLAYMVA